MSESTGEELAMKTTTTTVAATTHPVGDTNSVADETHNYSYYSDHSTSSPMCITPKPSTKSLIEFWSNPHETGMTMSFSHHDKSSTGNNVSNVSGSNHLNNGSIQSMNSLPETSMRSTGSGRSFRMKNLLDSTNSSDDVDCNEGTEVTESTTENSSENLEDLSESHQDTSSNSKSNDIDGITPVNDRFNEAPVACQSVEYLETSSNRENDSVHSGSLVSTFAIPVDNVNEEMDVVSSFPSTQENGTSHLLHIASHNGSSQRCKASLLPPLPPTARRSNRKTGEGSAPIVPVEPNIAEATENHNTLPKDIATLDRSTETFMSNVSPKRETSAATTPSEPFVDSSLSTIHDEMEQSFHGRIECNCDCEPSKLEKSSIAVNDVATKHPFSPDREVILSDDDVLDLTSIHSEDSDGKDLRNTRHHIVDIEEDHYSLMQDVYIMNRQDNDDDGDDMLYCDNDLVDTKPSNNERPRDIKDANGDDMLYCDDDLVDTKPNDNIAVSMVDRGAASQQACFNEETATATATATFIEDIDKLDIQDTINVGDSREHNRSNDTEHMLANVIDAAEKSILKGQKEKNLFHVNQLEPSMFFDCEDYDTSSQIRADNSSLSLKFLTINEQLSPLATIRDCEVYQNTEINKSDVHMVVSPVTYPTEHLFDRVTPLRSNSSRVRNKPNASSTNKNIAVPPLKRKASKKKLFPRLESTEPLQGRNKREYRKRDKQSSTSHMVEEIDDDELSSSVSTLDMDDEKDENSDNFWIDAFLDFVSPPEDSRSIDSDSSTSTGTGSNGLFFNVDAREANTISTPTDHGSSQKQYRHKKKPPTSLSRLREWWQKELIEEVMKGSLVKPLHDGECDSVDRRGASNDTVEKIVSNEFHKVLYGQKVSLLGSRNPLKEEAEKPTTKMNSSDWLEALKATIESATSAGLGCGVSESAVVDEQAQVQETAVSVSPKSFDSLDDLVRELKNTKIETDPAVLRGHFQSMYNQLQLKFKNAHVFDQTMKEDINPSYSEQNVQNTEQPDQRLTESISRAETINQTEPVNQTESINQTASRNQNESINQTASRNQNESINQTENTEQWNDDEPYVEVLPDPDVSSKFLLVSKSPMYSPPTSDYVEESVEVQSRLSGKSTTRAAKALAQAKAAIAQRRRAASKSNTVAPKDAAVCCVENEKSEKLQNIIEDRDISVALEDLDISIVESATLGNLDISMEKHMAEQSFRTVDSEDNVRVTFNDPSLIDPSVSTTVESIDTTNDITCSYSIMELERTEESLIPNDENGKQPDIQPKAPSEFQKDVNDKINVTKETVTDHSGSEESIYISSELNELVASRIPTTCPEGGPSIWQSLEPRLETFTASESVSANGSNVTGEYYPLESSCEKQGHELGTSERSDSSADQMSFAEGIQLANKIVNVKLPRLSPLKPQSIGSQSSNLEMMTTETSDDITCRKQRLGFKSNAFRKAQSYVAMQTMDRNSSVLSTSKSISTCESDLPVLNGKVYSRQEVRPVMDRGLSKKTKMTRNASLLSIIRKRSKKERSQKDLGFDVSKTTLISSTDRGSDDDTFPQGNDFEWEEFHSNTFYTTTTTTAEI